MQTVTLGISGASGMPIAFALLEQLLEHNCKVRLVITTAGIITIKQETGIALSANPKHTREILRDKLKLKNGYLSNLEVYTNLDWYAPIASGSSVSDAMVICPCSMATLGKIAAGIGDDLLIRAADVTLKERKNLILVIRESPLSAIHLLNMHKLASLGVAIIPPMLEFYTNPKTIADLINFNVARVLDQIGIETNLAPRW